MTSLPRPAVRPAALVSMAHARTLRPAASTSRAHIAALLSILSIAQASADDAGGVPSTSTSYYSYDTFGELTDDRLPTEPRCLARGA